MEDNLLSTDIAPAPSAVSTPDPPHPIAPWWHTFGVLLLLAGWAGMSGARTHSFPETPHPVTYLSQVMMTWMLFGAVIAGIFHRRAFFFSTLRNRALSFWEEVGRGGAIYLGIYFSAVVIAFFVVAITSARTPNQSAAPQPIQTTQPSNQTESGAATPLPPPVPDEPQPLNSFTRSRFHFDSKTVRAVAPRTPLDLLLWIVVSLTAGFCEEHIFRGYLLKQATVLAMRAGLPRLFAIVLSIAVTSLIFGSLHLYEGLGGALLIAGLGVIYSVIALQLGNLRAVIAAHFLQDFFAGLFLFLFHARLAH